MDLAAHTSLIEKLTQVMGVSEETVSQQNLRIRLADLHSERARLYAMENQGKGEATYKKEIDKDRKTALSLYDRAFKVAKGETQGRILLQMAHLNRLLGQSSKSKKLFEQIIKDRKRYSGEVVAEAFIEAGDMEYNSGQFSKALRHFRASAKIKASKRKSYANYRIAWTQFHLGNTKTSIRLMTNLLKDTNSFKRIDGSHDSSFQEEASRDLATFFARNDIKAADIQTLIEVSPANVKESNLTYLANELDRGGKKHSSLQVWSIIGSQKNRGDEKIEGQIKIARIQYDLGKKTATVKEIDIAAKMLKRDCEDAKNCEVLQQQLRKIITDWGKAEEVNPSAQLISAYQIYTDNFVDLELSYWAGIAAHKRKQFKEAFTFYKKSAELSFEYLKDKSKKTKDRNINTIFEGSLLGAIDVAEQSKLVDLRDEAYAQYMKLNPEGQKALEVEYQIAHLLLEKKKHSEAANKFREIALTSRSGPKSIKDKSADLSLDTLVIIKDDEKIESWALEYAQKIPKRSSEFLVIARKSILNQAANAINNDKASDSELERQYKKLVNANLKGATNADKINFYKHRSLIAVKIKDVEALIASSNAIYNAKGVTAEEKNEALIKLTWANEMKFHFKSSYSTYKRVKPAKNKTADYYLKLGTLAELAGYSAISHYEKFISHSRNKTLQREVAFSIVRLSKNKTKAFNKHSSLLSGNLKLYMQAGLMAYEHGRSASIKKQLLRKRGSSATFEGQQIERIDALADMNADIRKLSRHKLRSSGPKNLKNSIQERINLIAKVERATDQAIRKKDFTLQLVGLSSLSAENKRLAQDILKLPTPKGLKAQQRAEYRKLIEAQVAPYNEKSQLLLSKTDELWNKREDSIIMDIMDLSTQTKSAGSKLATEELAAVNAVAKKLNYKALTLTKKRQQRQKLSQELDSVRSLVAKNPFDSRHLKKMKEIETKLNDGPMVAYLDARLSDLNTGARK